MLPLASTNLKAITIHTNTPSPYMQWRVSSDVRMEDKHWLWSMFKTLVSAWAQVFHASFWYRIYQPERHRTTHTTPREWICCKPAQSEAPPHSKSCTQKDVFRQKRLISDEISLLFSFWTNIRNVLSVTNEVWSIIIGLFYKSAQR